MYSQTVGTGNTDKIQENHVSENKAKLCYQECLNLKIVSVKLQSSLWLIVHALPISRKDELQQKER